MVNIGQMVEAASVEHAHANDCKSGAIKYTFCSKSEYGTEDALREAFSTAAEKLAWHVINIIKKNFGDFYPEDRRDCHEYLAKRREVTE